MTDSNIHLNSAGHLKESDICRWIAGERPPEAARHLEECAPCRASLQREVEQTAADFGGFQAVTRAWTSDVEQTPPVVVTPRKPALPKLAPALMLCGAALAVVLAAFSLRTPAPVPSAATQGRDAEDVQLMKRVRAQVDRTAPRSMQPLAQLMKTVPAGGAIQR